MKAICYLHNGEINGANYYAFSLLQKVTDYKWEVYVKKPGEIQAKFETELGIPTKAISSPTLEDFNDVKLVISNTIMNFDVTTICIQAGIAHTWVIHESFPLNEKIISFDNPYQISCLANITKIKEAFLKCNHVVFVSTHQEDLYKPYVTHQRKSVIYNGIDTEYWDNKIKSAEFADIRAKYDIKPSELLVIQVGTVGARKNQLATLEIAKRTPNNIKFLIVGARYVDKEEIKYIENMRRIIAEYQLEARVKIIDVTDWIENYYTAADLLLCTSYNEALPLSICEAMLFKLPVVSSNVNGIPEVVKQGVGFLHHPDDIEGFCHSIGLLASNKELRSCLGQQAKELVNDKFSFSKMLSHYKTHFNKLIANSSKKSDV